MRYMKKGLSCILSIILIISFCTAFFNVNAESTSIKGIDVSVWDGNIDYKKVKNDKIKIVYIRACYGRSFIDSRFESNYLKAKKEKLNIGFYQYVTARSVKEGIEQAKYFYKLIRHKDMRCLPVMDFESFGNLSKKEINKIAIAYMDTLEKLLKYKPMLYSDQNNASVLWDKKLSKYPLWVAEYGVKRPGYIRYWKSYAGFQYSDSGKIKGISATFDLDKFSSDIFIKK